MSYMHYTFSSCGLFQTRQFNISSNDGDIVSEKLLQGNGVIATHSGVRKYLFWKMFIFPSAVLEMETYVDTHGLTIICIEAHLSKLDSLEVNNEEIYCEVYHKVYGFLAKLNTEYT